MLRALGAGLHSLSLTIYENRFFPTPPNKDYYLTTNVSFFMYLLVLSTVNFQNSTKKVYNFTRENFQTRLARNNILRRFDSNVGIISVKKIYYKPRAYALQ